MVNSTANSAFGLDPVEFGAGLPVTPEEDFVTGVYRAVDEATARQLDRLRREEGIVPTCTLGCCHCCRYHILTNVAEAHTLAQYIKRELSEDQIDGLRIRTQQWHASDDSRAGRYPAGRVEEQTDSYDPYCPLLVGGACIAYPVRPVVCRTHFVRSHDSLCRAANDPETTQEAPVVLKSVLTAAGPFSSAIRSRIEDAGLDFTRSIMLLPHWLALEMGWDFSLSR